MEQPPAWLRHQAVEASALAMVSMTWKKVTGSVSMPLDERGISRRNSRASCSLSRRAGGRRRFSSISSAAASTIGRSASARAIDGGIACEVGGRRDERFQCFLFGDWPK